MGRGKKLIQKHKVKTRVMVKPPTGRQAEVPAGPWAEGEARQPKTQRTINPPIVDFIDDSLRPNPKDIATLPDKDLADLLRKNWAHWMKIKSRPGECLLSYEKGPAILQIKQPFKLYQVLRMTDTKKDDEIDELRNLNMSKGDAGACVGFQCMGYGIPTISYLMEGARYWIVVRYHSNPKLEEVVAEIAGKSPKHGCLRGQNILLSPECLDRNNIDYEITFQRANESIIMFPGVYFGWINLMDNTSVARTPFLTEQWFEYAKFRAKTCCSCRQIFTLDFEKTEANLPGPNKSKPGSEEQLSERTIEAIERRVKMLALQSIQCNNSGNSNNKK